MQNTSKSHVLVEACGDRIKRQMLKAKKLVQFGQMECSASLYCIGNDNRVCKCNMMTRAQPKYKLISTDRISWSPVGAWTPELHIYAFVCLLHKKKNKKKISTPLASNA